MEVGQSVSILFHFLQWVENKGENLLISLGLREKLNEYSFRVRLKKLTGETYLRHKRRREKNQKIIFIKIFFSTATILAS